MSFIKHPLWLICILAITAGSFIFLPRLVYGKFALSVCLGLPLVILWGWPSIRSVLMEKNTGNVIKVAAAILSGVWLFLIILRGAGFLLYKA